MPAARRAPSGWAGRRAVPGAGPAGRREPMAAADAAWLRIDSPRNRLTIVGAWFLEAPIAPASLAQRLRDGLLAHRRLRQVPQLQADGAWWVDDPSFDLDQHLRLAALPRGGGQPALHRLLARLAASPLPAGRPPWQVHLVAGVEGGCALVMRLHHCIADGVALMGLARAIADPPPARGRHVAPDTASLAVGSGADGGPRPSAPDSASRGDLAEFGAGLLRGALEIATLDDDSPTSLKGPPAGRKALGWNEPLPLADVLASARVLGVSVNDLLLSCVAGALRRHLAAVGEAVDGVSVRVLVPVNLRDSVEPPDLGNRFGLVPVRLPVGTADPFARLHALHRQTTALKAGMLAPLSHALSGLVAHAPAALGAALVGHLGRKVSAVVSSLSGPTESLRLVGQRVRRMIFWVPQAGTVGLGISILTYDGQVQVGVLGDAALCPDPHALAAGLNAEFDALLLALAMLPRGALAAGLPEPGVVAAELFGMQPA
jgi:diacylglycerol O-acyltransferase